MNEDGSGGRPLDPATDPVRWERLVGRIMAAARPELRRRAARRSPWRLLVERAGPITAAAASVALVAGASLVATGGAGREGDVVATSSSLAAELTSARVAAWVEGERSATVEELVMLLERGGG